MALAGVRTGLGVRRNTYFASLVPSCRGKGSSVGKSGTVVPPLTTAAAAPQRPSRAGAGDAPHLAVPKTVKLGGRSLMWGMQHRARGCRGTK